MGCHKQLSLDFVAGVTPKTFHNQEYRRVRANILQSQERSLLPGTQHLVEAHKVRKQREGLIIELNDEQKYLRKRIAEIQIKIGNINREIWADGQAPPPNLSRRRSSSWGVL